MTTTVPLWGFSMPAVIFSNVVFLPPLGPSITVIPGGLRGEVLQHYGTPPVSVRHAG